MGSPVFAVLGEPRRTYCIVCLCGLAVHHCGWRRPKIKLRNRGGTSGGSPVRRSFSSNDQWLRICAARFWISNASRCLAMLTIERPPDLTFETRHFPHAAIVACQTCRNWPYDCDADLSSNLHASAHNEIGSRKRSIRHDTMWRGPNYAKIPGGPNPVAVGGDPPFGTIG